MIPIGDSIPTRRTPVVTRAIIVANIGVFLFELLLGRRLDAFVEAWGATPLLVAHALGGDPRVPRDALVTLITSQFLHAGFLHLGGNMLFLWIFGDNVEDRLGRPLYLLFYLVCGVAAALVQTWIDPGSRVPLIGASGAIAGVLGAYFLLYPGAWVTVLVPLLFFLFPIPVPAVFVLGLWFVSQFLNGVAAITTASHATGGVAVWAHVGGFLAGMALISALPKQALALTGLPRAISEARPRQIVSPTAPTVAWRTEVLPRRRVRPPLLVRAVSLLSDIILVLIAVRVLVVLFGLSGPGPIGLIGRLVELWSWPLVHPFAEVLPLLRIGGISIELYSLGALLVYQLLFSLLAGLLDVLTPRSARA